METYTVNGLTYELHHHSDYEGGSGEYTLRIYKGSDLVSWDYYAYYRLQCGWDYFDIFALTAEIDNPLMG